MHILDYLRDAEQNIHVDENSVARFEPRLDENSVRVEYRLVCSGTLFPRDFPGDWNRSDTARVLLSLPVELLVASRPYDSYPQELVLRFVVPLVSETDGKISHSYHPDQETASDVAALLTLLCRRLVTVAVKVREQHQSPALSPILEDFPVPAATVTRVSYWKPRPMDLLYSLHGVRVRSYHPPPQPFDTTGIITMLLSLPKSPIARAVLRAARLYALAMELIESQVEICYQLFISAVETMAGAVLKDWEPDPQSKISAKGNGWSKRKFKKFLLDNLDRGAIGREDDLFIVPQEFCPKDDQIEKALGKVYDIRSGATHAGRSYPASAAIGPSPSVPAKAIDAVVNLRPTFPPIGWFERVVNNAVCNYLRRELRAGTAPEGDRQ
ncbi:MAG: hypothetical protein JW809_09310 [Pirellulales bacterium]|nr:hypothetical protein [Pirellulales bacterium]